MNRKNRVILHSDMNSFYASVELIDYPQYKGLPLAVGGDEENRHGIILAKTLEAKKMGVKTGEAIWEAKKKCPNLIILPPHYEKYLYYSKKAHDIYYDYTNQVEPYGMDECWLDVTGSIKLFESGEKIAEEIRNRIKKELSLTVSIGVSFNKVFAKLGSDMKKPDAVTIINKENFKNIVWPLKCEELIMVGKATKKKLNKIGIKTIGDIAKTKVNILKNILGINGVKLWKWANGIDDSEVRDYHYKSSVKTIGHGITTKSDLVNDNEVRDVFQELAQDISRKLIEYELLATGVAINVRSNLLTRKTFQKKLAYPTFSSLELTEAAMELFKQYDWNSNLRTLTIRAIDLIDDNYAFQVCMFENIKEHERNIKLENTIYSIRKKHGENCITYCNLLVNDKMPTDDREKVIMPYSYN
ncbi:DNA polymerase IV [Miniphocaeibacter halophilus]|uniref:DNA polymerase IV n=1 Tax=Miniphocaeibacter halophilus TaxID=2931922 RepID=A0AC61MSY0_9FIRM|nr:DNA polymerase IV [Miniphocaeibacter halophilus]QQK07413.1 DNA polymerase IV [Miniphocaeibacter halophilus]